MVKVNFILNKRKIIKYCKNPAIKLTAFPQVINISLNFKFILLFLCVCYNFFVLNYLKISPMDPVENPDGVSKL